jgi:dissimilatory sulfite reductase (desulfoviridin) alpha/beta subunit
MNTFHETEAVYKQMSLILKEINRLSNIYEEWKIYLLKISNNKNIVIPTVAKSDIENLKFLMKNLIKKYENKILTQMLLLKSHLY